MEAGGLIMSGEPTLGELLADILRAKWFVLAGTVLGVLAALAVIWAAVPQYKATMIVGPAARTAGGMRDVAAMLPDNANLAFEYVLHNFSPGEASDFMRFEHILREAQVASVLVGDDGFRKAIAKDRRFIFSSPYSVADAGEMAAYLQKHIRIEPVGATPLRRLVYRHPDPVFAVSMLGRVHDIADHIIRAEAQENTQHRIGYLQAALDSSGHPDHRRALTALLMEQEHINMVLNMEESFAAAIAEPAFAAVRPDWPRKPLLLVIFAMMGAVFGYAGYSMRGRAVPLH